MHRFNKLTVGIVVTAVVLTASGCYTVAMSKKPTVKPYRIEGQGTQTIYHPDGTTTVVPTLATPESVDNTIPAVTDPPATPAPATPETVTQSQTAPTTLTPYQQWQLANQRQKPKISQGTYTDTPTN